MTLDGVLPFSFHGILSHFISRDKCYFGELIKSKKYLLLLLTALVFRISSHVYLQEGLNTSQYFLVKVFRRNKQTLFLKFPILVLCGSFSESDKALHNSSKILTLLLSLTITIKYAQFFFFMSSK